MDRIDKFLDDLEETFAHIRERECGDSVCGLCEYDGAYIGESGDWYNECPGFNKDDCFKLSAEIRRKWEAQLSQEGTTKDTTSDTINRQQVVDIVEFECGEWRGLAKTIIKGIEQLPSAQPEQRWISCSERLPEKDGRYQVTRYDYVANTEFIDILWYEENLWWNRHSTGDYAVTAWMPLPEPYAERREE